MKVLASVSGHRGREFSDYVRWLCVKNRTLHKNKHTKYTKTHLFESRRITDKCFFRYQPPGPHTPKLEVSRTADEGGMKDDAMKDGKTARCVGGEGET